jgi:hypothetical protein
MSEAHIGTVPDISIDTFKGIRTSDCSCYSSCRPQNFTVEYKILVRKSEGMRPLGRPNNRWEDNMKMDFKEVGCQDVDWILLALVRVQWQALVNTVRNLQVP